VTEKSPTPHLQTIIAAIEHINAKMTGITLDEFEFDIDRQRIVERNVEIISEASRRLPNALKARYPEIPWKDIAGIGNILRHDYENVIPDAMWKVAHEHLEPLETACRSELARETL
jgi:uncharacterized protein with HEPN domain